MFSLDVLEKIVLDALLSKPSLNFSHLDLDDHDIENLITLLSNKEIEQTSLNLEYNHISNQGVLKLAQFLENHTHIKTLHLSRNCLEDKGSIILSRLSIETLFLSNYDITDN